LLEEQFGTEKHIHARARSVYKPFHDHAGAVCFADK